MKILEKYLKFLKDEYKKKKDEKSRIDKFIDCAKKLIEVLNNNVNSVNEDDLKKIFERIDSVDTEKKLLEFKNIKRISIFFNDKRFENQPQIIAAKKGLDEIRQILKKYLEALELFVSKDNLDNLEIYQQQIDIIERIKNQERISLGELEEFYKLLLVYFENEEVNEIIMQVFNYMFKILETEVEQKNSDVVDEKEEIEDVRLTTEEKNLIIKYKNIINEILILAKESQLTIPSITDLKNCIDSKIMLPLEFISSVKAKFGLELTSENVRLLEEFSDILLLEQNYDLDVMGKELRELLVRFDEIFQENETVVEEDVEDNKEILLNIIDNPRALVIYLDDNSTQEEISYVEEDYEEEMRYGDRRKANTAVKKIITQFYTGSVNARTDGEIRKYFGNTNINVLHALTGRDIRCFYANMPMSEAVRKYLCETYKINIEDIRNFRLYLYVGFLNIGNHGRDYAKEQYNRCNLPHNVFQVAKLQTLFSKQKLDSNDMMNIDKVIERGFEITKKLNDIERKKRYE